MRVVKGSLWYWRGLWGNRRENREGLGEVGVVVGEEGFGDRLKRLYEERRGRRWGWVSRRNGVLGLNRRKRFMLPKIIIEQN